MILVWVFSALITVVSAAEKSITVEGQRIRLDIPKTWQTVKNPLGLSLVVAGPYERGKKRAILSLVPTTVQGVSFDSKALSKEQEAYQKGRTEWVKKYRGNVLEFFPYQFKSTQLVHEVHAFGYRYQLGSKNFEERTLYLICGPENRLFHIKTLFPEEAKPEQKKQMEKIVGSFKCG